MSDEAPAIAHFSDYRQRFLAGGPRLLFVVLVAEWCAPCRAIQPDLVDYHQKYGDRIFFADLLLENTAGVPAGDAAVIDWANIFAIPFDMMREETPRSLHEAFRYDIATIPNSVAIDLCEMTILDRLLGAGQELEAILRALEATR